MKKLLCLALFTVAGMSAQLPTYNLNAPFNCDASTTRPLTSFYQFDCRGVTFTNPNDGTMEQLFWFSVLSFYANPPGALTVSGSRKYKVDLDQAPNGGSPGVFQVEFQYQTTDGLFHYGIWSGTWTVQSGFRSVHPRIETGTLQFDSSTVAILD